MELHFFGKFPESESGKIFVIASSEFRNVAVSYLKSYPRLLDKLIPINERRLNGDNARKLGDTLEDSGFKEFLLNCGGFDIWINPHD